MILISAFTFRNPWRRTSSLWSTIITLIQTFTARTIELDPPSISIVFLVACVCTPRIAHSAKLTNSHPERIDYHWEGWLLERTIPLITTVKHLFLHNVIEAVPEILRIEKTNFEKIKIYFLIWIRRRKCVSRWYRWRYLIAPKAILYPYFLILLTLIIPLTALITLPARPVIDLLTSFLIFYRRDDGILKLGEILQIRIIRLTYSLIDWR